MKSFRQYLAALDRLATAQPHQIDSKKLYRAILATTFVAGSQFLGAISATANPVPTPAQPSPLLPTRFILNGNFEDTQVTNWVGPWSPNPVDWPATKENLAENSWTEYHNRNDGTYTTAQYAIRNPDPQNLRYGSTDSFSSTKGVAGNNIATANVRKGYAEPVVNPAAKPVIWLTSETGEFRSLWNYSDAIEIFRGDCSFGSTQSNITTSSRNVGYNPCGEKSAPTPLVAGNAVNGTTLTNGTADSPTNQFAEIQGSNLATLYQDIYVFPGETVGWSLRHAARNTPDDWNNLAATRSDKTNIMQVSITDPDPASVNLPRWNDVTPPVNQANAYYSSRGDFSTSGTYPATKEPATITQSRPDPLSTRRNPRPPITTTIPNPALSPITSDRPFIATNVSEGWKKYSGSWPNATNTIPKAMRFGFASIQGSGGLTTGNFIDDVVIDLTASADFLPTYRENEGKNVNLPTHTEGNTANPYYLSLRINGKTTTSGTITISMAGLSTNRTFRLGTVLKGSAAVSGMTAAQDGSNIILTIPPGTYNPNLPTDYIHIPIDFSNTVAQPNNNLVFTLFTSSTNLLVPSGGNIAGMGRLSVETRLIDDDYQKRVELPVASPVRIAAN
jgi:hypothetical protein